MSSKIPSFTRCVGRGDVHRTVLTQLTQENRQNWFLHSDLITKCLSLRLPTDGVAAFWRSGVPAFRRSDLPALTISNPGRLGTSCGTTLEGVNQDIVFEYECEGSI